MRTLVTGAGGMIGGHLVKRLLDTGHEVVAVDSKHRDDWYQLYPAATNVTANLFEFRACQDAVDGVDWVYNLAADMGGIGFIEGHKAECMLSVVISSNMLLAAREAGVDRFFFSSSACAYPGVKQTDSAVVPLREDDAYPADPEDGYGWEKLFTERLCRHFWEDFGLETRVARYHNVYAPWCTYSGGREKAPAAICRKVAEAVVTGRHVIDIWGDGQQTRSFMWIDDCIEGTLLIAGSNYRHPLNLGSSELVTIDELVTIVEEIAGVQLERRYDFGAPQGVRGRNSDNSRIKEILGWEPSTPLRVGMAKLYQWVHSRVAASIAA